jgi:capsular exopolysaccharide synthesis family protein
MENAYVSSTTMRDYLRVLFRQKAVFITCVVTVMATVIIGLLMKTPVYTSSVKLLITASKQVEAPYYRDIYYNQNIELALTQSEIVKSTPVLQRSVVSVGLYQRPLDYEKNFAAPIKKPFIDFTVKSIEKRMAKFTDEQKKAYLYRMAIESLKLAVKVQPIRDTNMFTISVSDYSPVGSAILANVISRSYAIFDLEQQLAELQLKYGEKHLSVLQLQDNITKLSKGLNGEPLSDVDAIGPASVKIIEQAQVPIKPDGLPRPVMAILALFMSIFLGIMLAFTFEYMDQTFKSPQEVEQALNLPYLGSIPCNPKSKCFDVIDEQLLLLAKDKGIKTLMFTTAVFEPETQNVVQKIARSIAEKENLKVLVIDANFRKLALNKISSQESVTGLVDVIEEKITMEKSVQSAGKNLTLLASGKTELNPVTILDSSKMEKILKDAAHQFDLIFIDAPDLTKKESVLLSSHVDGVILVINESKSRKQVVQAMLEPLKAKNARILGVILNNRTFAIPSVIYNRV